MKRGSWILVAGAISLVALTGCPPAYPNCSNDEGCKEHSEYCVQGQCRECAVDQNCRPGFTCQQSKCVPKPECTGTGEAQCGSGKKCSEGKCVTAAQPCKKTDECPGGTECQEGLCQKVEGACRKASDCGTGEDCKAGRCTSSKSECKWDPIHFGFNEDTITADAQSQLSGLAECIKSQNLKVRLEGHADERGTEEYNLQLSNRRAESVKKYLVDLGVPGASLETVGYGENRPAVKGSNEEAWAANRRVEFRK